MNNPDRHHASFETAVNLGRQQAAQDQEIESAREQQRGRNGQLPLERILPRLEGASTREQKSKYVASLAENIATVGLLHPLVVDRIGRIVAGGHRLAAITLMRDQNPTAYAQLFPNHLIPVRILPFDSQESPQEALLAEISENEHRRDYSPAEIKRLLDHLRSVGFKETRGRPKAGERPIAPALMIALGKSRRSIIRLLAESATSLNEPNGSFTERPSRRALNSLHRAIGRFRNIANSEPETAYLDIIRALEPVEQLISRLTQSQI